MKNEAEFNSVVKRSIDLLGLGHKIPDTFTTTGVRAKAPFDGFGSALNKMIVWESKFLHEPEAFNFKRLEDHQIESLLKVYESFTDKDRVLALFIIGVNFGRGDIRAFIWKNDDLYTIDSRKKESKSILKKEFLSLDNYVKVKKGVIDLESICNC